MTQSTELKKNGKVSLVVYDFDQTITCDHLYHRLDGGQVDELERMSDEKLMEVFGGEIRIQRLNQHFTRVKKSGAVMAIVSYGYVGVIEKSLERMGLGEHWTDCVIIGCDSQELIRAGGRKAAIIDDLRSKYKLTSHQVLFVDDDPTNIRQANVANCSLTLGISPRRGMTEEHMSDIEKQTALPVKNGNKDHENGDGNEEETDNPSTLQFISKEKHNNHTNENEFNFKNNYDNTGSGNGNVIKITSPRTVMNQSSKNNKSTNATTEQTETSQPQEEVQEQKEKGNERNNGNSNRTDWSKFTVTVPKKLENLWNNRDRENSDTPVVHIKGDSLNSDDESGPALELPPELPFSHS